MPGRVQVGDGHADPDAVHVVARARPDSFRFGMILVFVFPVTGIHAGLVKGLRMRLPGVPRISFDGNGAVASVEITTEIAVGLHLPEIGQNVGKSPLVVSLGRPGIVIIWDTPVEHLSVDRAGPAGRPAPWHLELGLFRGHTCRVSPVVRPISRVVDIVTVLKIIG